MGCDTSYFIATRMARLLTFNDQAADAGSNDSLAYFLSCNISLARL